MNRFIDALRSAMPDLTALPDHASLYVLEKDLIAALGEIAVLRTAINSEHARRRKPAVQEAKAAAPGARVVPIKRGR